MTNKVYLALVLLFCMKSASAGSDIAIVPSGMVYQPAEDSRLLKAESFKGAPDKIAAVRQVAAHPAEALAATAGPKKTGIVHVLSKPVQFDNLAWEALPDGGYAIKAKIHGDQAKRLRLHLRMRGDFASIQLRLKGNAPPIEAVDLSGLKRGDIWLPITEGDETIVELYAPSENARNAMSATLDQVNYQFTPAGAEGQFAATGSAQYAERDVACWSSDADYAALKAAASGTAKINFISGGDSYRCTGTLLSDATNRRIPWLITANHCIGSQSEANTMTLEWFYQAPSCGSRTVDSRYKQTSGGAQLVWTTVVNDATLLKLNSAPPSGTVFLPWKSDPLRIGQKVWAVHHPKGDHAMASLGYVDSLNLSVSAEGATRTVDRVKYSTGGVEPGSSGSGLFAIDGTTPWWVGVASALLGGSYQDSVYGTANAIYEGIRPYLDIRDIDRICDWAESEYPAYFPKGATTQTSYPYSYRYYATTGNYLATSYASDRVIVHNGRDWNLLDVGSVSDFRSLAEQAGF